MSGCGSNRTECSLEHGLSVEELRVVVLGRSFQIASVILHRGICSLCWLLWRRLERWHLNLRWELESAALQIVQQCHIIPCAIWVFALRHHRLQRVIRCFRACFMLGIKYFTLLEQLFGRADWLSAGQASAT